MKPLLFSLIVLGLTSSAALATPALKCEITEKVCERDNDQKCDLEKRSTVTPFMKIEGSPYPNDEFAFPFINDRTMTTNDQRYVVELWSDYDTKSQKYSIIGNLTHLESGSSTELRFAGYAPSLKAPQTALMNAKSGKLNGKPATSFIVLNCEVVESTINSLIESK